MVNAVGITHGVVEVVFTDYRPRCRVDNIIETQQGVGEGVNRLVEEGRINNTPTGGGIDPNKLVLFSGDPLGISIPAHNLLRILNNGIDQRYFNLQTGIEVGVDDFTKTGDNGNLSLLED